VTGVSKMLNKLKTTTIVSTFDPIDFPAYVNEDLILDYMVKDKAVDSGRRNSPSEAATSLDSNELDFLHKIETIAVQSTLKVGESTRALRDSIDSLSITERADKIDKVLEGFESEVQVKFAPQLNELEGYRVDAINAEKDLAEFKKDNALRRTASYPESNVLTFSILGFTLLVETFCNGFFFAKGSDLGLLGGVVEAVVISLINISLGFIFGRFIFCENNHISSVRKKSGAVFSLLFIVAAIIFNLFIAHYRAALEASPDQATLLAIETFKSGILSISDVGSWLLFLFGLLFYSIAAFKGYHADDAYPGYGRISRRKNNTKGDIDDFKQQIIDELNEYHSETIIQVDQDLKGVKQKQTQLKSLISSFEHQLGIYNSHILNLYSNLNYIITVYRERNIEERETPPPSYFLEAHGKIFQLEEIDGDFSDKREHLSEEVEKLSKKITSEKNSLLQEVDNWNGKIEKAAKL